MRTKFKVVRYYSSYSKRKGMVQRKDVQLKGATNQECIDFLKEKFPDRHYTPTWIRVQTGLTEPELYVIE